MKASLVYHTRWDTVKEEKKEIKGPAIPCAPGEGFTLGFLRRKYNARTDQIVPFAAIKKRSSFFHPQDNNFSNNYKY